MLGPGCDRSSFLLGALGTLDVELFREYTTSTPLELDLKAGDFA